MLEIVEKMLEQVATDLPEKKKQELGSILERAITGQETVGASMGLSPDNIEYLYSVGYQQFHSGNYQKALPMFSLVVLLDRKNTKYFKAIGECYFQMKQYKDAIDAFMSVHLIDIYDPWPFYRIAECYLKLNDPKHAVFNYGMAFSIAGDNPKFAQLKTLSKLNFDSLAVAVEKEHREKLGQQSKQKKEKKEG